MGWRNNLTQRLPRWQGQALCVLGFGLLAVLIGQDANWDLLNYHLYNAHAFLNGRIGVDLAAAGLQSYFNPLLDLPYYWMSMNLPPRVVAFTMGALHGLNLLLVVGITRTVLPQAPPLQAFLLALAGCLGATFLSELGNTMGDNTTALFVLASLSLCLRRVAAIAAVARAGVLSLLAAGLLMGLGVGLKLTNAVFALGLCLALVVVGGGWRKSVLAMVVFGLSVLLGLALTSGYWFARMWTEFGNPLFPQFNALFGSPLAAPISIADTRWRPTSLVEALLFPFVFTRDPARFGETPLLQLLWPIAYALFCAWGGWSVLQWIRLRRDVVAVLAKPSPEVRLLLAFVAGSYLVWLAVFSIGRYTVAMEVLLPLVVWLLLHRLTDGKRARWLARVVIVLAVVVGVVRFNTWGTVPFAEAGYKLRAPEIAQPVHATVLMLASPAAWMVPFFPQELVFVSLFQFPESPGYYQRAADILRKRGGDIWAVLPVTNDTVGQTVARFNAWAEDYQIAANGSACNGIRWLLGRSARYRMLTLQQPMQSGGLCVFEAPLAQRPDLLMENRNIAQQWVDKLRPLHLRLTPASCTVHEAYIGARSRPYQFCQVVRDSGFR